MDADRSRDRERARNIVHYLTARLRRSYPDISKSAFSKLLYPEIDAVSTRNSKVASLENSESLTTAELVDLIQRVNQGCRQSSYNERLTPEEMLSLFQRLIQLAPQEKQELGLQAGAEEVLLQQALLNMRLYHHQQDYETTLDLYCASICLTAAAGPLVESSLEAIDRRIPEILMARFNYLPEPARSNFIPQTTATVQGEIKKILLQSGTQHNQFWNLSNRAAYVKRYLTPEFIERLTQAVAENELLLRDFPIFIQKVTIEDLNTLPLKATPTSGEGLFNKDLLDIDRQPVNQFDLADFASQSVIRVTVHFSLHRPEAAPVDFVISSSGIGGTLSQITKVINSALLADIACLQDRENGRDFFPIAHDVMVNQTIIQNNMPSPVWSHSLVMLCQVHVLAQAMSESSRRREVCFYDQVAFNDSIGRGDCCGFDFLQTVAKAALYARLRAIKHTGVSPRRYLEDLQQRIERSRWIREAQRHVTSYPFSSLAQNGWLQERLLHAYWDQEKKPLAVPQAVFDAYLRIAETYLREGMYRRAYAYLSRLKLTRLVDQSLDWYESLNNSQTVRPMPSENFSGVLLVRYQLCWATYYYQLDRRSDRSHPQYFAGLPREADQQSIIQEAWSAVNKAEQLVAVRLTKYLTINEISQGTFHPHYALLAQICFLRVRLLLFFPRLVPIDRQYLPTDCHVTANRRDANAIYGGCLYLLEKARLYAACDGDQEQYACYTAYQSCIYVMAAFLEPDLILVQQDREVPLTAADCMRWARQLRDHALLSYAATGRHCYYQIKEKSGISRSLNPSYGRFSIEEIPPIRETLNQDDERPGKHEDGVLYIDMELLSILRECCQSDETSPDPQERIYLFGSNACYSLFARGLYHLCSNDRNEFEPSQAPITAQAWDQKLARAFDLFTYASAMADSGGTPEQHEGKDEPVRMGRNFTVSEADSLGTEEYCPASARSVRDLFPYRVSEIADLARIFMAVSALLRMYVDIADRDRLREDVIGALSSLYREQHCQMSSASALLKGQQRYNGHLETFFNRCKRVLLSEVGQVQPLDAQSISALMDYRRRILKGIFDGLYSDGHDA